MAGFITPDVQTFRARHGGFTASDDTVSRQLSDAAAETRQDIMPETAWSRAVCLLAAHRMTLDGQGDQEVAQYHAMSRAGVRSIKDGDTEVRMGGGATGTGANVTPNGATPYGAEYDALLSRYGPRGLGICHT